MTEMAARAAEKRRAAAAAAGGSSMDTAVSERRAPARQIHVPEFEQTQPANAPARSVILLDGRTFHAKGNNTNGDDRWILNAYYCQPFIRQQDTAVMSVPQHVVDKATDTQRMRSKHTLKQSSVPWSLSIDL